MKRFAVVILVVLALPLATFAKSECPGCRPYGNTGGTLIGTVDGLSLSSTLTDYKGRLGANLGIVTITTGALVSGSLLTGGTFSDVGSSYYLAYMNGTSFDGTFITPITWSPVPGEPGYYQFSGAFTGTWPDSRGFGIVNETYYGSFNSNGVFTSTSGGGLAMINPEPGTLGLFATGLAAMAGALRGKLRM